MQLGVLIDTEDIPVPAAGAVVVPNKRGPNRFDDIWNMPPGKKLILEINKASQPVGENAGPWAKWLGTVARKPDMCPINYRSWHRMPLQYKNRCWEAIQAKKKGRQVERGEMYEVAYSHRDGAAVNATAGVNIAKMKELMSKGSQLQGNDIKAGILWQPDDAFG
nr:hypothetical protein CFP56_44705 [Quercus suber]